MPFIVTSCAFKIHRASGGGRGNPVLITILACSLGFLQRLTFLSIPPIFPPIFALFTQFAVLNFGIYVPLWFLALHLECSLSRVRLYTHRSPARSWNQTFCVPVAKDGLYHVATDTSRLYRQGRQGTVCHYVAGWCTWFIHWNSIQRSKGMCQYMQYVRAEFRRNRRASGRMQFYFHF